MNLDPNAPKDFSLVLKEHRRGRCLSELSYRLQELVSHVYHHGKGGTLTLKLDIRPTKENLAEHVLIVTDTITMGLPKAEDVSSFFFTDTVGNLSLTNPDQMTIPGIVEIHDQTEEVKQ